MKDDPWLDEFKRLRAAKPNDGGPAEHDDTSMDAASYGELAFDFFEQIVRGDWPVRMPLTLEIYAEGSLPRIQALSHLRWLVAATMTDARGGAMNSAECP